MWSAGDRVCRFQTRSPEIAEKFRHWSNARLVAYSVDGGYLRIFEERIWPCDAKRLVIRFVSVPNGKFSDREPPLSRRNRRERSRGPENVP